MRSRVRAGLGRRDSAYSAKEAMRTDKSGSCVSTCSKFCSACSLSSKRRRTKSLPIGTPSAKYFLMVIYFFWSAVHWVRERVNQSVNQSVGQSVSQPASQPASQPSRQSGSQSGRQQSVSRSIGQPTEQSVSQSVGQPTERSVSQSTEWSVVQRRSVSQSIRLPTEPSISMYVCL